MRAGAAAGAALLAALLVGAQSPAPDGPKTGSGVTKPAEPRDPMNGFVISRQTVDRADIVPGGPPRDGIRSVDEPRFVPSDDASWVDDATPVLGVAVGDDARAYPVHLMDYHQVVNDRVGGKPVAVTWDPLTGTPHAFERTVDGRVLSFGVSGLLYNSGFLMFDRETESLWSQFLGQAVSGPLAGRSLARVPIRQEDLTAWRTRVGRTKVLERPTPQGIDYRFSPFERYVVEDRIRFPVKARDERFHPKELVVGVRVPGAPPRAYLGSILTREGGWAEDTIAGRKVQIDYSTELGVFRWEAPDDVEVTESYWFAWKAFHPDTEIWKDPGSVQRKSQ
jgi:hypothetical protein